MKVYSDALFFLFDCTILYTDVMILFLFVEVFIRILVPEYAHRIEPINQKSDCLSVPLKLMSSRMSQNK